MFNDVRTESEGLSPESAPNVVFDEYAHRGVLAFQACPACEKSVFPPRVLCPYCGSGALQWTRSSGDGTVYSLTTISPREAEPYTVALIDVAEGYRMMSTVSDLRGEAVCLGDRVAVRFEKQGDVDLPVFVKVADR